MLMKEIVMKTVKKLAADGGRPVRTTPMPQRHLIGEEEKAVVMRLFDEAISTGTELGYNGKYQKQYDESFRKFMGEGFVIGVNSGTNAVYTAIGALQIDALSEIIVPAITDAGGVMPVVMMGCVPIVADTDTQSYNISAKEIEPIITERTRAIIVAHIGGDPVDMDPIMELARKYNLSVIEDCAQAHGAQYKGRMVGTIGDIAAFSTLYSKHHCTGGQGGVVFTKDSELYWKAKRFADRGKPFGIKNTIDGVNNVVAGLNCNLNDLSAAIGCVQLEKLPSIIDNRYRIGESIKKGLENSTVVSMGCQILNTKPVYWFLRMKLELNKIRVTKKIFCDALSKEGIMISASYRYIPSENPWFKNKAVLGKSGFPWNCSDYKGEKNPKFKLENAINVTDTHFNINFNENYEQKEIDDILLAINKVEIEYLK